MVTNPLKFDVIWKARLAEKNHTQVLSLTPVLMDVLKLPNFNLDFKPA